MANPKVTVEINGKDNASPVIKKVQVNLKEMGEKVSQLGMRMSAAFTLPLVGAVMTLNKFGEESAKAVQDAAGDLSKLSPEVIRAADAYNQMKAALQPVNDELNKAKASMMEALVPVLQQLAPLLVNAARQLAEMANQFAALPAWQQNAILGFVGLIAIAGPVVVAIGQIISTIGILKDLMIALPGLASAASTAFRGLGLVFSAASLPVLGLTAAITALIYLITSGKAMEAWRTLQMLVGIGLYKTGLISGEQFVQNSQNMGLTGRASGGAVNGGAPYMVGERGPELFVPRQSGSIVPNAALAGMGGGVTIVYSPVISTASQNDIERMGKLIEQAQRRRP